MKTQFGNLGAGIGQYINDKIINSENITVIAENQIQIGDTVYILNNKATLVPEGKFTSLPYGAKIGFAVSGAEIGEAANVKTIGRIAVDYNLDEEIATQDELITQIDAALDGKAKPQ